MINIFLRSNYEPRFKIVENFQCGEKYAAFKEICEKKKFGRQMKATCTENSKCNDFCI